jgi:hypothetical protein
MQRGKHIPSGIFPNQLLSARLPAALPSSLDPLVSDGSLKWEDCEKALFPSFFSFSFFFFRTVF